jgi:hypothetical protein
VAGCSELEEGNDKPEYTEPLPEGNGGSPPSSDNNGPGSEPDPEPPDPDPPEPDPDPPDPEPDPEPDPVGETDVFVDERMDVPNPGHYVNQFELYGPHEVDWDVLVRDGPEVNVFFTDVAEFQEYEQGHRFSYYTALTREDVASETVSATMGAGDYAFIIDTSRGDASSIIVDEVDVEVRLAVTPL